MKRDMRKYILRKLVELIFTLLFVTLLSFLLMRLSSVDPATAYAKRMIGNMAKVMDPPLGASASLR